MRTLVLGFLMIATGPIGMTADRPDSKNSPYIRRMIEEGLRPQSADTPPTSPEPIGGPHLEVEDEISLPDLKIRAGPKLEAENLESEEPRKPVLGTGVTEIKGKHYTIKVRRVLFLPIAFKLEW